MNEQLELLIDAVEAQAGAPDPVVLPDFTVTESATPAEIIDWWYAMVAIFTREAEHVSEKLRALRLELDALKVQPTLDARRRRAQLKMEETKLLTYAETAKMRAYCDFENALEQFTPTLLRLIQAEGGTTDDDEEMIADFWTCLQRPAVEWCATMPLREIVHHYYGDDD